MCHFRHVEAERKPNKKSKKGAAKGSVAILKESTQLGCVSQDSCPRKSFLRELGKLGSKHTVKFSKGTWHQIKNSRTDHMRIPRTTKDAPAKKRGIWRKYSQAQEFGHN